MRKTLSVDARVYINHIRRKNTSFIRWSLSTAAPSLLEEISCGKEIPQGKAADSLHHDHGAEKVGHSDVVAEDLSAR